MYKDRSKNLRKHVSSFLSHAALYPLAGHTHTVTAVSWAPQGELLASASHDHTVRLWHGQTATLLFTLQGHTRAVTAVAWAPQGDLLASASHDHTVRIWQGQTGAPLFTLHGHTDTVTALAWAPQGDLLASASRDRTVRIWHGQTGALLFTLHGHIRMVTALAWAPQGDLLASASGDHTVRIWQGQTGAPLFTLEGHTDIVQSAVWAPQGDLLASASHDHTVRIWQGQTGAPLFTLEGHTDIVQSAVWAPQGDLLASASHDHTVRIWQGQTGAPLFALEGHSAAVTDIVWAPQGDLLASASRDHTVRIWHGETVSPHLTLEGHTHSVSAVAWAPQGTLLASASHDHTVRIWQGQTGKVSSPYILHTATVTDVAWASQGNLLASASLDHTVRIWQGQTGILLRTLHGHTAAVHSVDWAPRGALLASASDDSTVRIWRGQTGTLLFTLQGHTEAVTDVAWAPQGGLLASASDDYTICIWHAQTGSLLHTLHGHSAAVHSVAWAPQAPVLASASKDHTVRIWHGQSGDLLLTLQGHTAAVYSVAWAPQGALLASASEDHTVRIWQGQSGDLLFTLEGHTSAVHSVAWAPENHVLVSQSDTAIHLWPCASWETVEAIEGVSTRDTCNTLSLLAHRSQLAALDTLSTALHIWNINVARVLSVGSAHPPVHYATARIALVGESGVGKSGPGYRLAENRFQVTESSHGQQFWLLEVPGMTRADGTICEAILWDFAGQRNFRPVHALFLDTIDLALLLFDPAQPETLAGVDYWLKQLGDRQRPCRTILVAARIDVCQGMFSQSELQAFCQERNISGGFVATSAKENEGIERLLEVMHQQLDWNTRATTVTTQTFKRIKDYVLKIKARTEDTHALLVSLAQLRQQLEASDSTWDFSDEELLGAIGHLQNHGYVTILRHSSQDERVLLTPDLLINLAASYLLQAQANEKGLGALEEARVLRNGYIVSQMKHLRKEERDILLNAVTELFLKHTICFRESADGQTFLIFPSLILERPPRMLNDTALVEDVAYLVRGNIRNVYPALVVLLGYAPSFRRTHQWRKQAQYETRDGYICSFKLANDDTGELELVLYYGKETPGFVRMRFQGLFEQILASREVAVSRFDPVICPKCGLQQRRRTVIDRLQAGKAFLFCEDDGEKITLPETSSQVIVSHQLRAEITRENAASRRRTTYETALVRVKGFIRDRGDQSAPTCFISYAWGVASQERWVLALANDLLNAGIDAMLDQLHNAAFGSNVARFISRMQKSTCVIVVGTPSYYTKYENNISPSGSVSAAEIDLINCRLMGTEDQKACVLPLLLAGDETTSFPPLLQRRVYGDFRQEELYFIGLFDLVLSLYQVPFEHPVVQDLRAQLCKEVLKVGLPRES
jgi:WD40 repeat protein/GTPase SAR1 family protein